MTAQTPQSVPEIARRRIGQNQKEVDGEEEEYWGVGKEFRIQESEFRSYGI
jgi:hypothetical protein